MAIELFERWFGRLTPDRQIMESVADALAEQTPSMPLQKALASVLNNAQPES
jgi:hypothetical protein